MTAAERDSVRHDGGTNYRTASNVGGEAEQDSSSTRADPWVDYVELAARARERGRSLKQLATLLRECLGLVWGTDRRLFLISSALQLLTGVVVAVQVLVTKLVLDDILAIQAGRAAVSEAVPAIVALAGVTAFSSISGALLVQQARMLSELTSRATWGRILDVAAAVDLLAYEGSSFYDQLRRVQTNAVARPYSIVQGVISLLGGVAGTVGVAGAIVALQPILLPLLLFAGIPLWYASRRASRLEFNFAVRQNEAMRKRTYLASVLTGRNEAKELRAFGLVDAIRGRYDSNYDTYVGDLRLHLRRRSRIAVLGNGLSAAVLSCTLIVLIWLVSRGEIGLAAAGAALVAIRMLGSQITSLFRGFQQVFESSLFMEDLQHFFMMTPVKTAATAAAVAPVTPFRRIDLEKVTFTYPGQARPALAGVTMAIEAGKVVAIVGENGSGKTTLAKLLAGLYDPDSGSINWGGQDVRGLPRESLRRSIAVIFQDFVRYQLTATENIGAGRPEAMDDIVGVAAAAEQAGAHDFLDRLPGGYETILSKAFKGGLDLSGGQWQRVALARAFYRDAPFVILDEPTASLDPRAEADLFEKIRELLAGRTVLLISHRFSSVRYADVIYVMKDGEIAEYGTHDELMARHGLYAELFTLQAAAYVDSPLS